jgi:uncharacterized protein DUF6597
MARENVPVAATDTTRAPGAPGGGPIDESVLRRPAAELRPFLARYSGYRQAGVAPARHAGLPSPYLTMIFTLDEPLHVAAHPDPAQPGGDFATLAGGLHRVPAQITHDGYQSGIQLAVNPLGARALLGIPAGELAGIDVEAGRSAGSWPQRFTSASGRRRAGRTGSPCSTRFCPVGWRRTGTQSRRSAPRSESPGNCCSAAAARLESPRWRERPGGAGGTCETGSLPRSG